jgi:hypothetical protein
MELRLRAARLAVGFAAAAGLVMVGAGPASANYTDCPATYACMWTSNSYPGSPNASYKTAVALSSSSNLINSISNNGSSSIARFYDASNYKGAHITLNNPARGGQTRDPMLSNGTDATSSDWSNRISSANFA